MLTLTALRTDLTATFTTSKGRHLYRAWINEHPILANHHGPLDAIDAAQNHHLDGDEILNAFLTLSIDQPLAQQAIVVGFHPWIGQHLRTHGVPFGDRDDQIATLIAAFTEAAVELSAGAPYLWPASTIIHSAQNPIDRYYRHLARAVDPIGQATELEHITGIELLGHNRCNATGAELVLAGLVEGINAARFTLADAYMVARIVIDGESARHQSRTLYLSPRAIQHRVRNIATRLANQAA
jgi:hypothetical protein